MSDKNGHHDSHTRDPQNDFAERLQRLLSKKPSDFLDRYGSVREHIHAHPELSECEAETGKLVAQKLNELQCYSVEEHIGGHGVAAVCRNGSGPTVLLRADMDALPLTERTGLAFASTARQKDRDGVERPVMHACGHDMHVAALLAVAELFAANRTCWAGTLVLIFQPAEENGCGAQAMIDDRLYERGVPEPDVVLAQHVFPLRAGKVAARAGPIMTAADSFRVTFHGSGGHGSKPDTSIDPIVMASSAVVRLQTILSREVDSLKEFAVVTVGSFQAGFSENVIPDTAEIKINIRTSGDRTRERVLAAAKRIVKAECEASNAPEEATWEDISHFPPTVNDQEMTGKLAENFRLVFGDDFDPDSPMNAASEDFSNLAIADKPYVFWMWGGVDPDEFDKLTAEGKTIPGNHSPQFKMATHPTLEIGLRAMSAGAMTFLDKGKDW